jgi:hypothetical protein
MSAGGDLLGFIDVAIFIAVIANGVRKQKDAEEKAKTAKDELNERARSIKNTSDKLIKELNANSNEVVQYCNNVFSITLSSNDKKFIIFDGTKSYSYSYDNLINIELVIDEHTTSSPSLGGAVVGGLLFGGVGAIIGSSGKSYDKELKKIVLRITVDDIAIPIHDLVFLSLQVAWPLEKPFIKQSLDDVNNWYGRFATIIDRKKEINANTGKMSIADEIIKLKQLLDTGVITNDEFETSKRKLF